MCPVRSRRHGATAERSPPTPETADRSGCGADAPLNSPRVPAAAAARLYAHSLAHVVRQRLAHHGVELAQHAQRDVGRQALAHDELVQRLGERGAARGVAVDGQRSVRGHLRAPGRSLARNRAVRGAATAAAAARARGSEPPFFRLRRTACKHARAEDARSEGTLSRKAAPHCSVRCPARRSWDAEEAVVCFDVAAGGTQRRRPVYLRPLFHLFALCRFRRLLLHTTIVLSTGTDAAALPRQRQATRRAAHTEVARKNGPIPHAAARPLKQRSAHSLDALLRNAADPATAPRHVKLSRTHDNAGATTRGRARRRACDRTRRDLACTWRRPRGSLAASTRRGGASVSSHRGARDGARGREGGG